MIFIVLVPGLHLREVVRQGDPGLRGGQGIPAHSDRPRPGKYKRACHNHVYTFFSKYNLKTGGGDKLGGQPMQLQHPSRPEN